MTMGVNGSRSKKQTFAVRGFTAVWPDTRPAIPLRAFSV
jgi:hypothetical protein